jgi:hypothetical protein
MFAIWLTVKGCPIFGAAACPGEAEGSRAHLSDQLTSATTRPVQRLALSCWPISLGKTSMLELSFAPAGVPLPVTNTQGQPRYRLSVLPSLGPALHVPPLCAAGSTKRERSVVPHTPAALRDWANKLRTRFGGAPIAVCIELSQGPIVSALLEHDSFVLFPVQPKTLARYRAAFTTSGAKDDPTDAEFALELLLRHPDKLARLEPESVLCGRSDVSSRLVAPWSKIAFGSPTASRPL